jgi:hypothetical protein
MGQKHNIFHGQFIKGADNKLSASNKSKHKYEEFIKGIEEGQTVNIFMEANKDDGTLDQLAKLHVCIRAIATETGESFEKTKLDITKMAGLCFVTPYNGENVLFCKSLADCSKEELSLVIETIIEVGDTININFR